MVGFISYHGSHVVSRHTGQTSGWSVQKINQQTTLVIYHDGSQFIPDEVNEQKVREHGKEWFLNFIKMNPMKIAIEAQRIFRTIKHGMDFVALETIRE